MFLHLFVYLSKDEEGKCEELLLEFLDIVLSVESLIMTIKKQFRWFPALTC